MAATIRLHVWTGADANTDGGSADSFSFLDADSALDTLAVRIAYPIDIPTTGCDYSYEKWLSACVSVVPTNNVGTFEIWGSPPDEAFATGTCWLVGAAACTAGSTPTNTSSSIATSSLADATSDSKAEWDAASYHDAACQTAYLVMALQATTTATVGNWGPCSLNYSYKET